MVRSQRVSKRKAPIPGQARRQRLRRSPVPMLRLIPTRPIRRQPKRRLRGLKTTPVNRLRSSWDLPLVSRTGLVHHVRRREVRLRRLRELGHRQHADEVRGLQKQKAGRGAVSCRLLFLLSELEAQLQFHLAVARRSITAAESSAALSGRSSRHEEGRGQRTVGRSEIGVVQSVTRRNRGGQIVPLARSAAAEGTWATAATAAETAVRGRPRPPPGGPPKPPPPPPPRFWVAPATFSPPAPGAAETEVDRVLRRGLHHSCTESSAAPVAGVDVESCRRSVQRMLLLLPPRGAIGE